MNIKILLLLSIYTPYVYDGLTISFDNATTNVLDAPLYLNVKYEFI
jgi:hypothetical protein